MLDAFETVVVVVGCQRSGTTLTGQILGAHPNAVMVDETDGLYRWFLALARNDETAGALWDLMLNAADKKYRAGQQRMVVDASGRPRPKSSVTHLVLKAPNLTASFGEIELFSRPVSVIYPVRDPRSVVASMARVRGKQIVARECAMMSRRPALAAEFGAELSLMQSTGTPDHVKQALVWRIKSSLGDRFRSSGWPVLQFQYEELISEPRRYCNELAEISGLPFDLNMLNHDRVLNGFGPGRTDRTRPIDDLSVSRWSKELSPMQVEDVLEIAAPVMQVLGYSV